MGPREEPGVLALLLALAAALYAVTWLLAGPPGDRAAPVLAPAPLALEVSLSSRRLAPARASVARPGHPAGALAPALPDR